MSAPIRKLAKNDLGQTVDQWREKTLHALGSVSGKWTAYVEKNDIPKVPATRPRPPIKPTSEGLMNALKTRLRESRFEARRVLAPEGSTDLTIDTEPMPSDYEVWVDYEEQKGAYQAECREYERKEKLALESFPEENRKVFSALIDCISEASVQDMKSSAEGRKYFDEHDSYNFFNLAIAEHRYLPPAISSAAVAKAKADFEGLRQKAEDTMTEHINEYRRLLEAYKKAR